MLANKNTSKIITTKQAMSLMVLAGEANSSTIMRHQARFAAAGIAVVEEDIAPPSETQRYDHPNVVELDGKWYRAIIEIPLSEIYAEAIERLTGDIQVLLDSKSKERRYDSIDSAMGYVTSIDPIKQAQAIALRDWRDACWDVGSAIELAVIAGTRPIPTKEEMLAEMPVFVWPE